MNMKAGELGKVHQAKVCGIQHWREHHNYSQRGFHNRQNLQSYQWQNQEAAPCKRMRTMCIEAFQRPEDTWADRRVPGEPEIEDVFETAAIRLQSVLDAEEGPQFNSVPKETYWISERQKQAVLDSVSKKLIKYFGMTAIGATICYLLEQPLWGSQAFSTTDQALHVFCAITLAGPIAALKWLSWDNEVQDGLPSIACYHDLLKGTIADEVQTLDPSQVSALFLAEIIAKVSTRMLLTQTALLAILVAAYQRCQESRWEVPYFGWTFPESSPHVTAAVLTALISGALHFWHYSPSQAQVSAVRKSMQKSDQYFGVLKHSKGHNYDDSARLSETFQLMASAWISDSTEAAILTSGLAAIEILLIGGLWQGTQDVWAALTAAALIYGADLLGAYREIKTETV